MLDDLLHHSHIVQIAGESNRLMKKEKRKVPKHKRCMLQAMFALHRRAVFFAPSIALDRPVL
jgi:hypothetical protein